MASRTKPKNTDKTKNNSKDRAVVNADTGADENDADTGADENDADTGADEDDADADAEFLAQSVEGLDMTELRERITKLEQLKRKVERRFAERIHAATVARDDALVDYKIAIELAKIPALGFIDKAAVDKAWVRIKDSVNVWLQHHVCGPDKVGREYMPEDVDKLLARRFLALVEAQAPDTVFSFRTAHSRLLMQRGPFIERLDEKTGRFRVLAVGA
jgi:hypothetical protein